MLEGNHDAMKPQSEKGNYNFSFFSHDEHFDFEHSYYD